MTQHILNQLVSHHPHHHAAQSPTAPLPDYLVWTERAAASLRAYLTRVNLSDYHIFHCPDHDLQDLDDALGSLPDSSASWELPPPATPDGHPLTLATASAPTAPHVRLQHAGFLHLPKARVVLARWFWLHPDDGPQQLWLAAAPCADAFHHLRQEVLRLRRARTGSTWTVVRGYAHRDEPVLPRRQSAAAADDLLLSEPLRHRLDLDIVRFFSPDVAALYRSLRVPYRRGVLLHGPPGNGKTSLIRHIGASLPRVPGLILRPDASFDTDDLEQVLRRWSDLAPAILVIEDLDWILEQVNVSTFLNLLDGIDAPAQALPANSRSATPEELPPGAGLLLIATTNHPEKLDPAVNNRPGRFDVAIEIPNPDDAMRARFFSHHLPAISPDTLAELVSLTPRLSFAHLHEILRLSGLLALHANHPARTDADLLSAARSVRDTAEDASRGFPPKLEVPFGLASLRRNR